MSLAPELDSHGRASPRRAAWVAAGVLVLAWSIARAAARPPAPISADAPATEFSAERAATALARVLGPELPHPVGSAEHAAVRARLQGELVALGLEPRVQDELVEGWTGAVVRVQNVLARVPGRSEGPALVLAAHYDSVAAGPGASDDGAGLAAILECARAVRAGAPLEHPLVLLFTDGEEVDLAGAVAFVQRHPWARAVHGVVNLEARGTGGTAWLFQIGPDSDAALARFAARARRPATSSLAAEVYARMPNDTDFSVFRRAAWRGFDLAFVDGFARYHTPRDELAALDRASLQQLGENALTGLAALDETEPGGHARLAWHDLVQRAVLRWPAGLGPLFAGFALAALAAAAWRRRTAPRALVRGALALLLALALGGSATWAASALMPLAHDVPDPWTARPAPWSALAATVGAAAAFAAARAVAPARADAGWLGAWLALAALAALAAIAWPGVAPMLLAPAFAAGLCAPLLPRETAGVRWLVLALAPAALLVLLVAPVAQGIELAGAFGPGWPPGLLAACCAAPAALVAARAAAGPAVGFGVLGLALAGSIGVVEAPTPAAPGWCNLVLVLGDGRPRWHAQTFGSGPPFADRRAWSAPECPVGWLGLARGWVRPAEPDGSLPPVPSVACESEPTGPGPRRVRLRVASARGAAAFALAPLGPRGRYLAVRSGAQVLELAARDAAKPLVLVGLDPDFEVELEVTGAEPLALELAEIGSGIPSGFAAQAPVRPPERLPRSRGDLAIWVVRVEL